MTKKCFNCDNFTEDEMHVILLSPLYESLRRNLFDEIRTLSVEFDAFCDTEKLYFILSDPLIAKASARTCHIILNNRRTILYSRCLRIVNNFYYRIFYYSI